MASLLGKIKTLMDLDPVIARVTRNSSLPMAVRKSYAIMAEDGVHTCIEGFAVTMKVVSGPVEPKGELIQLGQEFAYLSEGDVVWITPRVGRIEVIYRHSSKYNYLFSSAQCNCQCICCPQPPIQRRDPERLKALLQAIPLIPRDSECLGITGGEPTLLGMGLVELLRRCRSYLPETNLHLLSNGRNFQHMDFARAIGEAGTPKLLIGTPLFSDLADEHDFICQVKGAFDEVIRGLLNMHRAQIQIELRVVLHSFLAGNLLRLAQFIARNLPFVRQVSFMGLETVGFASANREDIWIDPIELRSELEESVLFLRKMHIAVSIFNIQLCILPEVLHPFARQSISDWKNEFLPACKDCALLSQCCGFFALKTTSPSRGISPVLKH